MSRTDHSAGPVSRCAPEFDFPWQKYLPGTKTRVSSVPDSGFMPHREGVPTILKKPFSVACAFCENYSPGKVENALRKIITACGGLPPLGRHVLLKPNLLSPRAPEDAVTTHPAVVKKTAELIKEKEPRSSVLIADNPGYIFTHQRDDLFHKTGMKAIQKEGIAELSLLSAEGYMHGSPWCAKK
jgi:uncharacterized protein (DUF362 family)